MMKKEITSAVAFMLYLKINIFQHTQNKEYRNEN